MAIFTTLAAVAGLGGGLLKGFGAQAGADARNRQRAAQAKIESRRAEYQYDLENVRAGVQWQWDMARTEQLRSVEAQNQLDSLTRGSQLIGSAIENLEINMGALNDIYGTQEQLRATQAGLEFGYESSQLADRMNIEVLGYMRSVMGRSIAANNLVSTTQRQSKELQQSLLLDQQRDYLNYNVQRLTAALDDSRAKATYSARQGTGATSKRLAMEAGQRIGKLAVEMDIKRQDRGVKTALFNKYMQGEVSGRIAEFALQSEADIDRAEYSVKRFGADSKFLSDRFEKLTIPSFDLAARQGSREMQSLMLQTKNSIQNAMQPYRQKTYFDPLKPIPGLQPLTIMPNKEQGPSTFSVLGGALLNGISGAMSGYDAATNTFM